MKKVKSIHFVGIKGVGMAPLAIIAKQAGIKVSGCDIDEKFITDVSLKKAGIEPLKGFSKDHINKGTDLVITTGAHGGFENEEVKATKEVGIEVMTQGQAVGVFMQGDLLGRSYKGISVAGSHGKTTTTAMIATILKEADLDPSFIIGTSDIFSLPSPGHFGKGKYFIAEADEYATEPSLDKTAKFLWQHPKILLFTNIDFDHPDIYPTIDHVYDVFLKFAKKLPSDGILIANGDDRQIQRLIKEYEGKVILYGMSPINNFVIKKVSISQDQMFFWVDAFGTSLGEFSLSIAGEHNAINALGAIVVALEAGVPLEKIKRALSNFKGSKRRSEYIGQLASGAYLFDDYAHHPTEIKKTLLSFRQRFPKYKLVCIFQPHTYSRTKHLFDDFISSFNQCDQVILTNIYSSSREQPDNTVSAKQIVEKMNTFRKSSLFMPTLLDVIEYINKNGFDKDTVIVTMGAGDIYKIAQSLKLKS